MSTKRQFKMYLPEELVDRLRRAAERTGRESSQEVAEEVLNVYLPVWLNVDEQMRRAVDYQVGLAVEGRLRSRDTNRDQEEELEIVTAREDSHGRMTPETPAAAPQSTGRAKKRKAS